MTDKEFLKLVSYGKIDESKEYLDNHDINSIFSLLLDKNYINSKTFNYIMDYYNSRISSDIAYKLINKGLLDIYDLPIYMYKEDEYIDKIFINRSMDINMKHKLIDVFIKYDLLTEKIINIIIGKNELDDNYNSLLYSDIKYTKVLACNNFQNGTHFKKSGINNEIIDILFDNGMKYGPSKKYYDCDLYKDFYYITRMLELESGDNTLNYININYDRYTEEELFKILSIIVNKSKSDPFFEFINHDYKLVEYCLDNPEKYTYMYLNKISDDIVKDESNGIVKKFIDIGATFGETTNPIILSNISYIDYMIDSDIKNKNNLLWVQYIDKKLLDDVNNGIVYKVIENNGYFCDIYFEHIEYIIKFVETRDDSFFYGRIPKNIINDPSNNVVYKMLETGFIKFQQKEELFNIKEYFIYYLDHLNDENSYSLEAVINSCNPNIIIDNNLFEKIIKLGYRITSNTPRVFIDNVEYMKFFFDYVFRRENYNIDIDACIKLLSDDIINDMSNGIIINLIKKGYTFNSTWTDRRILENRDYIFEFMFGQGLSHNIYLINELPSELLNDRELVMPIIENGYVYSDKTPKELYQIDYIKHYFMHYNNNESNAIWLVMNKIFRNVDEDILSDESNGLVYCAIDYGYEINSSSPISILKNKNYLSYYLNKNNNMLGFVFKEYRELKLDNIINDDEFIYSLIDGGYKLSHISPQELLSNPKCVEYALKYGKIDNKYYFDVDNKIIDESIVRLLLDNRITRKGTDFFKKYGYDRECDILQCNYIDNDEFARYIYFNYREINIDSIPKQYLDDKYKIGIFICFVPSIIDYIDDSLIDEELLRRSLINGYRTDSIDKMTKYINIIGLKEFIKYNNNVIEYYSEEEFNKLFNQDYKDIILYSIKCGYDIRKNGSDISDNLNNITFFKICAEHNFIDIINYANFDIDLELFKMIWEGNINLTTISDKLRNQIINNDEFFNEILKSNFKKLNKSINLFYPNNINHPNLDILLDKVLVRYEIRDRDLFKKNLSYLYSKNKELFYDLNVEILTDKYLFLGIETINRIIPDKNLLRCVLNLSQDKLKIFNLCINYLYSIKDDIEININDILFVIVRNLTDTSTHGKLCNKIVEKFINMDRFIDNINTGKTYGKHLPFMENLINVLFSLNNVYEFEEIIDIKNFIEKKEKYFKEQKKLTNLDQIKNLIAKKYYNISYSDDIVFMYKRYCYRQSDIEKITDKKLRMILYDFIFLVECEDMETLINIYNNISVEKVDFKYTIMLEGLIRNEYIKQYNDKLNSNTMVPIDDNIYEVEDNINLLVHVLGGYNSRYKEPANFRDEWNIELMTNHGVCTSYITNQNLSTARNIHYPTLVFTDLEPNSLLLSEPDDIGSNPLNAKFATALSHPCCFLFPDTMIDETRWHHNEVVLERKNLDKKSDIDYKRLPNYVLYVIEKEYLNEDESINWNKIKGTELWRMTEKASKDFAIPIIIINKVKINKKERERIEELKHEMLSTNNYSLINKIIVRYMNNLMDEENIITKEELCSFLDYMISLAFQIENGKEILETIYYTILEENRKFLHCRVEEKYNYIKQYETIVSDKIREYNSSVLNDKMSKM